MSTSRQRFSDDFSLPGDGFVLRAWRRDDLAALVTHANDAEVAHGLADRFPHPYTSEDGERFLAGEVVDFSDPVFAIEVDGQACGAVNVHPGSAERAHSAELGYWLGRAYWGRGLMTRVVGTFAPWAMRELRLYRLYAGVYDFNTASMRVLRKCGFDDEGVQRCAIVKRGRVHDLRMFAKVRSTLD